MATPQSPVREHPSETLHSHPVTSYALEHPHVKYRDWEPQKEPHHNVQYGPMSERRFIPVNNDEWQEGAIYAMMRCEHDALAMALITLCMQHPGFPPPWARKFDEGKDWKRHLYGALTQTMWRDRRDPYYGEYGRSFREAAALVAMLDVITGGEPGQTYMNYYCNFPEGTYMEPENTMAKYLIGLGFEPVSYPYATGEMRPCRGGHQCGFECYSNDSKCHVRTPAFCLLPKVLQEAITLYCGGTEGLAGFAMRLAPPVLWRAPSPGPCKQAEHKDYNTMVKRDREGYKWCGDAPERKRCRSAQK